jgi:hypothetical protein
MAPSSWLEAANQSPLPNVSANQSLNPLDKSTVPVCNGTFERVEELSKPFQDTRYAPEQDGSGVIRAGRGEET